MLTDVVGSKTKGLTSGKGCRKAYIYHWNTLLTSRKMSWSELWVVLYRTLCLRRFTCLAFSCLVNKTKFNCFRPGRFAFVLD